MARDLHRGYIWRRGLTPTYCLWHHLLLGGATSAQELRAAVALPQRMLWAVQTHPQTPPLPGRRPRPLPERPRARGRVSGSPTLTT